MANSRAKKNRLRVLREKGKDVTLQRGDVNFSTHQRMTKTKQGSLNSFYKKHKRHVQDIHNDPSGDAFCFFVNTTMVSKISTVPSQSIHPNATFKKRTDVTAADNGSAQAKRLVSEADKYFKLSR